MCFLTLLSHENNLRYPTRNLIDKSDSLVAIIDQK